MQKLDLTLEPEPLRRMEIITGVGRRRSYTAEFKSEVVAETLAPGAVVSQVARRHGLLPQQVFGWRRELRKRPTASAQSFAPVLIEGPPASAPEPADVAAIEITVCGATVRIPPGADARLVATVLRALRERA